MGPADYKIRKIDVTLRILHIKESNQEARLKIYSRKEIWKFQYE